MGLLLIITCLVDVPDVLGLSWFTMHMPAGAHVGMEAPLPVQRAVVAWAIMFYSTTMTLVAAGKGRDVCKMLAVCHMLVSALEVAAVWTAGRDGKLPECVDIIKLNLLGTRQMTQDITLSYKNPFLERARQVTLDRINSLTRKQRDVYKAQCNAGPVKRMMTLPPEIGRAHV